MRGLPQALPEESFGKKGLISPAKPVVQKLLAREPKHVAQHFNAALSGAQISTIPAGHNPAGKWCLLDFSKASL